MKDEKLVSAPQNSWLIKSRRRIFQERIATLIVSPRLPILDLDSFAFSRIYNCER
jgi:hypothetical protein